jgi:predicted ArsR family transcriptional regulator
MTKATQRAKILSYCAEHGSITIREAFEKLHINSPSKRISEMRLSGAYTVEAIEETRSKKNGEVVRYKRYFITKGAVS